MSPNPQSSLIQISKLDDFQKFEKDLNRLKHQLKMKRRIYDDVQFQDMNARVRQCEAFFKREKYEEMRKQADKAIQNSNILRNDVYSEMKDKLTLSRKIRVKPIVVDKRDRMYDIDFKTEESMLCEERVAMEYELIPSSPKKLLFNLSKKRVKTVGDVKNEHCRFVSDFERKIKAQLAKIPSFSEMKDKIKENGKKQLRAKIKSSGIRLSPIDISPKSKDKKQMKQGDRDRINRSVMETPKRYRYDEPNCMQNNSRISVKQNQKREIRKIANQNSNWIEKSKLLKNLYSKYDKKSKCGDDDALQLMSKANLARAEIILSK